MTILSVNLNKLALVRNTRSETQVDVLRYAQLCLEAGAGGITVHPRPDVRHIRHEDVAALASWLKTQTGEFNLEGNPLAAPRGEDYPGLLELVRRYGCDQCTLVPDSDDQTTSDHGWDLPRDGEQLLPVVEQLHGLGARVSLFMDPEPDAMSLVAQLGVERIELYTGPWAWAYARHPHQAEALLQRHAETALAAQESGLAVNAGHDLNLDNLSHYLSSVERVQEVSIGHALVLDAMEMGLPQAVQRYINCII